MCNEKQLKPFQKLLKFEGQVDLDGQEKGTSLEFILDMYDVDDQNRVKV